MLVDEILDAIYEEVRRYAGVVNSAKVIPFFGGDYRVADVLLVYIKQILGNYFVELFGGSCYMSQLLNAMRLRTGRPKAVVCNDRDKLLYKLYVAVRDRPRELAQKLAAWPYSREIYNIALELLERCERDELDDITCAALMYYILRSSIMRATQSFLSSVLRNSAREYINSVAVIAKHSAELAGVIFENKDFAEVINMFNYEDTTFYLDPPYVSEDSRYHEYRVKFTVHDLRRMAKTLKSVKGRWLLKIAEDNYKLIKNDLPPHKADIHEVTSNAEITAEKRGKWRMVLAYA